MEENLANGSVNNKNVNMSKSQFHKSETSTNGSKSMHVCSSTSSSTSSLSANNLNNLNFIEDGSSSVFEDDLISNSSHREKNHLALKSHRDSFSIANNYEDFDENEYETASNYSSCNLSKLKLQQEESDFGVLVKECQNWMEVKKVLWNSKFSYQK